MTQRGAARKVWKIARRLAVRLSELEGQPIDPSVFEIAVSDRASAARIEVDESDVRRAVIAVEPAFVIKLGAVISRFMETGFPPGSPASATRSRSRCALENAKRTRLAFETAVEWILLHEVAHWHLGHLHYAASTTGKPLQRITLHAVSNEFEADEVVTRPVLPDTDYHCIELQADFEATQLLDILHAEEAGSGGDDASGTGMTASRQLIAVAAGAVILLMQHLREKSGVVCSRHPIPEARAHNMMQVLMARSVQELGYVRDGELRLQTGEDERIRKTWADALPVFYRFLTPLARQLEVEPIFSRPELVPASDDLPAERTAPVSARDLMLYVLDSQAGPERFVTAGCKELARLRKGNRELMAALAPFMNGPRV